MSEIEAKLATAVAALSAQEARTKEQASLAAAKTAKLAEVEQVLVKTRRQATDADGAHKLATERQSRIDQLERQLGELQAKLSISRQELNRAEGQINLITDLMLRGGGL